jgi:prepilin-type N-terminal cleavage/methylation domain-containing protein
MKNNQGFTLIELLMVVLILSVMVGLSAPNFSKSFQRLELKKTAQDIVHAIRWAQSKAATDNKDYQLVFLNDSRSYQVLRADSSQNAYNKKFIAIPIQMGRVFKIPRSLTIKNAQNITIYSDGTLDKVRIDLEGQKEKLIISTAEQRGNIFILEEDHES